MVFAIFRRIFDVFSWKKKPMRYLQLKEITPETIGFDYKRNPKNSSLLASKSCR
jgi:hypothetical protein